MSESDWLREPENHRLALSDERYPELLKQIQDPPAVLYVRGDPDVLSLPQLAVVGSRNPTAGGRDNAYEFARHLAGCGLTITSGLALGVDAASHEGALAGEGFTVAVCATGLDTIYPRANEGLAGRIANRGALVSEFPPGTPARREHFPQRNRIISGLSVGTLVVEAAQRSGSLITARHAGDQGREVFAIPGSIHNPMSRGCHRLIRQGAKLVESAADILQELETLVGSLAAISSAEPGFAASPNTDPEYARLLDALGFDPVTLDTLTVRTGLTTEELSSMLLILELEGDIESGPGGVYARVKKEAEKQ